MDLPYKIFWNGHSSVFNVKANRLTYLPSKKEKTYKQTKNKNKTIGDKKNWEYLTKQVVRENSDEEVAECAAFECIISTFENVATK